jgi:hypothetical protein
MVDRWAPIDRFEKKYIPEPMSGCWLWTAGLQGGTYGSFYFRGRSVAAHRWSYEHHVGPVPNGLELDHKCCVKICVNPAHLRPVTSRENTLLGDSAASRNAGKTHCVKGHEFTPENTIERMNGGHSFRACRVCRMADRLKEYAADKASGRQKRRAARGEYTAAWRKRGERW